MDRKTGQFLGVLALMLALATAVQIMRDRTLAYAGPDAQVLYVRSGEVMRKAALSYSVVLADVYWIRALQYYGRERLKPGDDRGYELLYPLLDLSTSLDPRFTVGYRFGAIFLAEPHPGGAGRPDQAIALLEKGISANPVKWDYYHDIGFIYYWSLHDYKSAASWFQRGGELPGAPWWLKTYAAVMLTRGGDRQSSRAMWERLGQSEENGWLRQTSQLRLMQLDALDQIDTLQGIVREFARVTGAFPRSWEQLVAARMLAAIPVDPSGTVYSLDFTTGIVNVPSWSKIYPLPTEPTAAPELKTPVP